jgi:hypothetical protein
MPECFAVIDGEVLDVLLDLPGGMHVAGAETHVVVSATDGARSKVLVVYFVSDEEKYQGQVDLNYRVDQRGATVLHSIRYSSGEAVQQTENHGTEATINRGQGRGSGEATASGDRGDWGGPRPPFR